MVKILLKPFTELTRLGRVRRMRQLARTALNTFKLDFDKFILARSAGNTLYRVFSNDSRGRIHSNELFEPGQFLLRIHWPGYREKEAIELELAWLRALRQERDLPVPEPVPTPDGSLVVEVSSHGIPGSWYCSLLRWVKGRRIGNRAVCKHYAAQGRLMAEMHDFAETWHRPEGTGSREYDWNGLFKTIPALGLPVEDVWSLLTDDYLDPFESVTRRVRVAMNVLGQGPDTYGLIHADLGVDANLLFWQGHPRVIDFDELGSGYWIYDLAVALEHCREQSNFARYRDALLDAYSETRSLSKEYVNYLELFMAALDVHIGLWANAVVNIRQPQHEGIRKRAERCLRLVREYLEGRGRWMMKSAN